MKSSAWLIAAVTLALLTLIGVGLAVMLKRAPRELLPADTPSGVTQRFLQACQARDYPTAYDYLTERDANGKVRAYDQFRLRFRPGGNDGVSRQVFLASETITGDTAEVYVRLTRYEPGAAPPFGNPVQQQSDRFLLRREQDRWRIVDYPYWVASSY